LNIEKKNHALEVQIRGFETKLEKSTETEKALSVKEKETTKMKGRITELEEYCDELFEKLNRWTEMDSKAQLLVNKIDDVDAAAETETKGDIKTMKALKGSSKENMSSGKKIGLISGKSASKKKNNFTMNSGLTKIGKLSAF
jgi:hypothetical protein